MTSGNPQYVDETVARLATVYEAVGPRLGCCLVEAHVLLLLAGLRGQTDLLLYEPAAGDAATVERLNQAGAGVRARIVEEDTVNPGNKRRVRVLVLESLAGYAYVSTQSQMRGLTPFDQALGWEGLERWGKAAFEALKANYESEPVLLDRWIGLVLGYPDRAVDDACEAIAQGRSFDTLARADIPSRRAVWRGEAHLQLRAGACRRSWDCGDLRQVAGTAGGCLRQRVASAAFG